MPAHTKPVDVPTFAKLQLSLLQSELDAELAETSLLTSSTSPAALQRAGLALLNLQVSNQRTGLGGKTVLELELDPAVAGSTSNNSTNGELPEHGLRVGDIVSLQEQTGGSAKKKEKADAEKKGVNGVVVKAASKTLSMALDKDEVEVPGSSSGRLWIVKLANDITYKRMSDVLRRLEQLSASQQSVFISVLFGQSSPSPVPPSDDASIAGIKWVSERLNDSQKAAIHFALHSKEIALIHGPPGTGKTHTLIELILQLINQKKRLLVCGPSNVSVDNIVERLSPHKVPMVRLGHPARLLPSVLNHSLDVLTRTSEAAALVQDVRKEMDQKQASIRKTRSGRERRAIYGELKELRREYKERERGCVDDLIRRSKVILATLHGAGGFQLKNAPPFDVVIIDEASQALEAQCWVALLSANKAVLAGDHLQLPPTIKSLNSSSHSKLKVTTDQKKPSSVSATPTSEDSKDAESGKETAKQASTAAKSTEKPFSTSLETTLFDRLLALHGPSIKRMLTTQYRMHEKIMAFPSKELYDSKLVADDSVKERTLPELKGVESSDDTMDPLVFYDTQGAEFPEDPDNVDEDENKERKAKSLMSLLGDSKSNRMEVSLVRKHVQGLVDAGLSPAEIAVITPYNAQLSLLSQSLRDQFPGLELGSVDGFQGREKEAVIVSLVRSNPEHEVGFLGEKRRLNVAMTRPKRQLTVIGDSETISRGSSFLKRWMAHLEEHADLRYPDAGEALATDA